MILYTIMPEQLVYPADYSQCESQKVVNINGVELMVSEEEHGYYCTRVKYGSASLLRV